MHDHLWCNGDWWCVMERFTRGFLLYHTRVEECQFWISDEFSVIQTFQTVCSSFGRRLITSGGDWWRVVETFFFFFYLFRRVLNPFCLVETMTQWCHGGLSDMIMRQLMARNGHRRTVFCCILWEWSGFHFSMNFLSLKKQTLWSLTRATDGR